MKNFTPRIQVSRVVSLPILIILTPSASFALDADNFACKFDKFSSGQFRKQGASAVLTNENSTTGNLQVSEFWCESGVSTQYSEVLLCSRTEEYAGVARSTSHIVFTDNYTTALLSTSNYSPDGDIVEFGTSVLALEADCQ